MKKIFCNLIKKAVMVFAITAVLVTFVPRQAKADYTVAPDEQVEIDGITYDIHYHDGMDNYVVARKISEEAGKDVTILAEIEQGKVTNVADGACSGNSVIETLTLSEGIIVSNGWICKNCPNLTVINLPTTLCVVRGVLRCPKLEKINVAEGSSDLMNDGDALLQIEEYTSVDGKDYNYSFLTYPAASKSSTVHFMKGTNYHVMTEDRLSGNIYVERFVMDEEDDNYTVVDGVLFSKDMTTLYKYPSGKKDTSYTVPDTVTTIESYAFYNAIYLKELYLPDNITEMGSTISGYIGQLETGYNPDLMIYCNEESSTYEALESDLDYVNVNGKSHWEQKVTVPQDNYDKAVGDADFNLNATTNGDGKLCYRYVPYNGEVVAEVDGQGNVHLTGEEGKGSFVIYAEASDKYKRSKEVSIGIRVSENSTKKTPVITAKSITKTYTTKAFSLNASSTGDGKLTYKSSKPSVATVNAKGQVTCKGYGVTEITISSPATSKCKAAVKKITVTVKPSKMKAVKLTASKGALNVSWTKDKKATGYEIRYSSKKNMSKAKTIRIKKVSTTKKVIKSLKSKTTYYVQIRAYKKDGSVEVVGSFSSSKAKKTK
ncbi:MAG: leucine-rich repeat protein [Lachnospiraceae bacterium]